MDDIQNKVELSVLENSRLMKLIKPYIYGLTLLLTLGTSCQEHTKKQMDTTTITNTGTNAPITTDKFYWQETISCPTGYPIDVYHGNLEWDGGSTSLYLGTHGGPWGITGRSMSSGVKGVPKHLDVIWLSYAEDTFYHVDTAIDYDKMVRLFSEGYPSKDANGEMRNEKYNYIVVGMAPGGVVVIWLSGPGRQVEVGRYKGDKIVIPAEEIAQLDSHEKLLFSSEYRKEIMENEKIVPKEFQHKNKNQSIPFNLWDSYRERYSWRPVFVVQNEGKMEDVFFTNFNGEQEEIIKESIPTADYVSRAIPNTFNFGWRTANGKRYGGTVKFDEKEIVAAFSEIHKVDKKANIEIEFRVNQLNTFITVVLKSNGKEIPLTNSDVKVYESRKK